MAFQKQIYLNNVEQILIDVFYENKNIATQTDLVDAYLNRFPYCDMERAEKNVNSTLQQLKFKEIIRQIKTENINDKKWTLTNLKF